MQEQDLRVDTRGSAVVEAAILFPIMIMIFAALVLLARYLPTRAVLQQATQYAATALATSDSDTWLEFDAGSMTYYKESEPDNVYAALLWSFFSKDHSSDADTIVSNMESRGLVDRPGKLTVECSMVNYVVYKEIVVTATREIPMPVDLSFVRFPNTIPITVTSTAVVQNGDEFVRNMDIAADVADFFVKRFGLQESFDKVGEFIGKFYDFLGI